MAGRDISVTIYTRLYWMLGQVDPGVQGMFSYMNLRTESFVEIEDVQICPLHQPAERAERFSRLWLVKSEIAAVALSNRSELGQAASVRGGYTKPLPYGVRVLLGNYEIRGVLETPGKFDFGSLMFEGDVMFVPLHAARLNAVLFPRVQSEKPAMLFNRKMVDAITLQPLQGPSQSP